MKKMYSIIFCLICISNFINAQWKQTMGPGAGKAAQMINVGNDLYVANSDFTGTDPRVYRSTDLGVSWFPADNGLTNPFSNQFENIGNTIFSATSAGVFRTQNAGANWVLKNVGAGNVLSMTHRDSVLFIGQEGPGVKVSYDLGKTFIPRNNGILESVVWVLSMARFGRYVYAGIANGGGPCRMYRTGNDGLLWTLINNGLPDGGNPVSFTINGSAIFTSVQGVGISGDHVYGVYRSLDSGLTWQAVNTGLPNNVVGGNTAKLFTAYGNLYVSTTYPFNEPMLYKSSDSGNHWNVVSANGFRNNQPVFSFAAAGGYVFAGLASYGSVFRTNNGGATSWEPARNGLANSSVNALIKQKSKLYAGSQEGLYYTTNKGNSWTQVDNPVLLNVPVTTIENNGNNIYLGSDGLGIYRSTDNGTTWAKASTGLNALYATYINDILYSGNALYAATWSGVYKSTNNGASWTLASAGLPSQFGDIVETNTLVVLNGTLYVGTVLNKIYKSTNDGASWTFSGNGLTTYASTIHDMITAGSDLYAATEAGIYKSTDAGANWFITGGTSGLWQKLATYKNGKAIFASKYNYTILTGLGVFVSTNKGVSFTDYSAGLFAPSNVQALLVDSNNIYAGTDTRSVWIRKLQAAGLLNFNDVIAGNEEKKNTFTATATNPFNNKIDIQLQASDAGKLLVSLIDNSGRVIAKKEAVVTAGKSILSFTINKDLVQGLYVLQIIKNKEMQSINLLKE